MNSGMSWPAIFQIETGRRRNLRPATLSSLAGALGVSVDYLLDGGLETPVLLNHCALVYESKEAFAAAAAPFIVEGLERSESILVVTSKESLALLGKQLGAQRRRVKMAESTSWYTTPSEALSAFGRYVGQSVARGGSWVRIIAEPIWDGRSRSKVDAWIKYESMLNLSFAQAPCSFMCPYDKGSLPDSVLSQAHMTHPMTTTNGNVHRNADYVDPATFILGD